MAAEFLREHQFIVDVMSACTHDVSMEVRFEYLRPLLVDIFPRMTLSRDEGHGRASCEIMINICDSAKRLSKDDFVKFVDAIHKDHPTSAQLIRNKYKEISGKDLPSFPSQPQRVLCRIKEVNIQYIVIAGHSGQIKSQGTGFKHTSTGCYYTSASNKTIASASLQTKPCLSTKCSSYHS
ncbi:hypothetical protein Btru_042889 [Bulinus truncatus]|nr:hypothetical protein Btru_042889 [Bulinus truncatus]